MARPHASFPFVAIALGGAMYLANCGGDTQNSAPAANRPPSMTFTSGQTVDTVGAAGSFDTTGYGGWGGDFGTGGSDDDGSAGSGGEGADAASRDACATGDTDTFFLSDLNWIGTPVNGFGPVERDTSNGEAAAGDGHPMSIAGMTFDKGLGVHANSSVEFGLGGKCKTFSAYVGPDDEVNSASITFEVWVDGVRAYSSPSLVRSGQAAAYVEVDVSCASSLRLVVTDGVIDGNAKDHADWGDAQVSCVARPGTPYVDAGIDRAADVVPDRSSPPPVDASSAPDTSVADTGRINDGSGGARSSDATFVRRDR